MWTRLPVRAVVALSVVLILAVVASPASSSRGDGPVAVGSLVLPDSRTITPAGAMISAGDFPAASLLAPSGRLYVVDAGVGLNKNDHLLGAVDPTTLASAWTQPLTAANGVAHQSGGMALSPDGSMLFVSGGRDHEIMAVDATTPVPVQLRSFWVTPRYAGALAVSHDGRYLFISEPQDSTRPPYGEGDSVDRLDLTDGSITSVTVGNDPLPLAVGSVNGRELIVVGNEADNTISVIDAASMTVIRTVRVDRHPSELAFTSDGQDLLVVCSLDDEVIDLDTTTWHQRGSVSLRSPRGVGATPSAIAVSPDDATVYVTLAEDNAVAVIERAVTGALSLAGRIPTAWWPSSVQVVGNTLLVTCAKGVGLDTASPPGVPVVAFDSPGPRRLTDSGFGVAGTLEQIPIPDATTLTQDSAQVAIDNRWDTTSASGTPLPAAISHAVLIIRENKTYDEEFGDEPGGDPAYVMYGKSITPNAHAIAERFALLESFYDDEDMSDTGHQALFGSISNEWVTRLTNIKYGGGADHGYDIEDSDATGAHGNGDAVQWSPADYLLDDAVTHHVSVRDYGEFYRESQTVPGRAATPDLDRHIVKDAPGFGFNLSVDDTQRANFWAQQFANDVAHRTFPQLEVVYLPLDHTGGTAAGGTPTGQVEDNDIATGRIISTLSHSPYWTSTAVFVEEDDAQGGFDHVDAHRSIGLVASPWVIPHLQTSAHYDQESVLRTIELITGMPPMTEADATAVPMTDLFGDSTDLTPYDVQTPTGSSAPAAVAAYHRMVTKLLGRNPDWSSVPPDVQFRLQWLATRGTHRRP